MAIVEQPINVGTAQLKNRLMMAPMATQSADSMGYATSRTVEWYSEKASSGALALVETEHSYVDLSGKVDPRQLSSSREDNIPGLAAVAEAIHRSGSLAMLQVSHGGSAALSYFSGRQPMGPSEVMNPIMGMRGELPRAMTQEDINCVIGQFAAAADRGRRAGFDVVELHAAHGYLLNQFYSPLTNHRTDDYNGQTIEGRTLLLRQVIRAVRKEVGPDFPISVRLGGCDYLPGGSTIEDAAEAALLLEKEGVNLLSISGGMCVYMNPTSRRPAWFDDQSAAVKAKVNIPVVLTGNIRTRQVVDDVLENGKADIIGAGRMMIKDTLWPEKVLHEGE